MIDHVYGGINIDKVILAIGGAVVKTAREELRTVIEQGKVEMLIHNGGSIFHDFQIATDKNLTSHSYPLDDLVEDFECNREASEILWDWVKYRLVLDAPAESVTGLCERMDIPVLMFTALGCDYWHMFGDGSDWADLGSISHSYFRILSERFKEPFHYICMGSAVIHPEVFVKALSINKPSSFRADVVDFLDMYRPKTRIAKYGNYYKMKHKTFLKQWATNYG